MKDEQTDKKFEEHAKKALDESVDALDRDTLNKLRMMRRSALDATGPKERVWDWHWLRMPAGAMLMAALIVLITFTMFDKPQPLAPLPIEDLEILASNEDAEFFAELEFYEWLADEENSAG